MTIFNVLYSAEADVEALKTKVAAAGTILKHFTSVRFVQVEAASKEALAKIEGVTHTVEEQTTTVTPHTATWHLQRLVTEDLPLRLTYRPKNHGEGSVVYLIDSGVQTSHPELEGASIVSLYGTNEDPTGHGTALASLIVGKTVGVARGATVKVAAVPMSTEISVSVLLEALDAILADHTKTSGVKVVNCSWTIPKNEILDTKIAELESAGLVVVAAAGNSGVAADTLSPVGLNSVLGVGASDAFDRVMPWVAGSMSNWGPEVDVFAPGVDVTCADTNGGLSEKSGTSIATAIASAVVAQFITDSPALSAAAIQQAVIDAANDDQLFWDDTVFGTTPNRLISSPVADIMSVWGTAINTVFPVKAGTQSVIGLTPTKPLVKWDSYGDVALHPLKPEMIGKAWEWISSEVQPSWLKLTLAPPADLAPGYYTFWTTGYDAYGVQYIGRFRVGVYATDPSELADGVTPEHYSEPSGTIVITPAFCQFNTDCPKGSYCCTNACGPIPC